MTKQRRQPLVDTHVLPVVVQESVQAARFAQLKHKRDGGGDDADAQELDDVFVAEKGAQVGFVRHPTQYLGVDADEHCHFHGN